jgi:hypothetical protein
VSVWTIGSVSVRVNCLKESVMEEGIFHVELLNGPVTRDNSGRFYNRAECLVIVNSGALSETPKDSMILVAIKGPISTELVREDPLAGDNIGALRSGNQLPSPIVDQGVVLFIAARQWGSAITARAEEGISVGEEVATMRRRRSGTTQKAVLSRLAIVAATITAIAVFVVVLGPVVTGATVSIIRRVRRRGRWWLGCRGCNADVEHRQGSRMPGTVHVNLLQ